MPEEDGHDTWGKDEHENEMRSEDEIGWEGDCIESSDDVEEKTAYLDRHFFRLQHDLKPNPLLDT